MLMKTRFFHLNYTYKANGSDPWVISFPFAVDEYYDVNSEDFCTSTWNSNFFAFAYNSPNTQDVDKLDFPAVVGEWHVASARLAAALSNQARGGIEFLPFRTRTTTGEDITDNYRVIRYLKWVYAVDRKHSKLCADEKSFRRLKEFGGNYDLDKVVLARHKLVDPVCRIVGWSPYYIFREDVVDSLLVGGFTGLDFKEVDVM